MLGEGQDEGVFDEVEKVGEATEGKELGPVVKERSEGVPSATTAAAGGRRWSGRGRAAGGSAEPEVSAGAAAGAAAAAAARCK